MCAPARPIGAPLLAVRFMARVRLGCVERTCVRRKGRVVVRVAAAATAQHAGRAPHLIAAQVMLLYEGQYSTPRALHLHHAHRG